METTRIKLARMRRKLRPKKLDRQSTKFKLWVLLSKTRRQYSQKELAAKLAVSVSTVGRALRSL